MSNETKFSFPPGARSAVISITVNSSKTQVVSVVNGSTSQKFKGSGERNQIANFPLDASKVLVLTTEYEEGGSIKKSHAQTGGPYIIGNVGLFVVAAENGDDADYNDTVITVQFKS